MGDVLPDKNIMEKIQSAWRMWKVKDIWNRFLKLR